MKQFLGRIRWFCLILTAGLVALFIVQNAAVVDLRILHLTIEARRSYIVGISLMLGGIVGWAFGASRK